MYKIERTDFGYKLTFGGLIRGEEMKEWLEESQQLLASAPSKFGVLVDMRQLEPLPPDAQPYMLEGQRAYKSSGMERSAVGLADRVITLQFMRIAKQTGIHEWERYVDASSEPDWEEVAMEWIDSGNFVESASAGS